MALDSITKDLDELIEESNRLKAQLEKGPQFDVTKGTNETFVGRGIPEARLGQIRDFESKEAATGFWDRVKLSFKFNKTGALDFLRKKYGEDNVLPVTDRSGSEIRTFAVKGPDEILRPIDPDTGFFSMDFAGDVGDIVADVVESGPGIAAAAIAAASGVGTAASLGVMAAGDAVGSALKQWIGSMISGDEAASISERGGALLFNVGTGLATEGGQAALKALAKPITRNIPGLAGGQRQREFAQALEGKATREAPTGGTFQQNIARSGALEDAQNKKLAGTGHELVFTPGQSSGSLRVMLQERALAQMPEFIDDLGLSKRKQLEALGALADRSINMVAGDVTRLGDTTVSGDLISKGTKYLGKLRDHRRDVTKPLFREVDRISGNRASIGVANSRRLISTLLRPYKNSGATSPIADAMQKDLEALGSGRITASTMQDLLQVWGERISDPRKFESVIPGADSNYARQVFRALQSDLDLAVKGQAPAARKLRIARDKYRELSEPINAMPESTLRRFFKLEADGKTDKIMDAVNSMGESELRGLYEFMSKADKATADNMRAQYWTNLFEKSGGLGGTTFKEDIAEEIFSPARMGKLISKKKKQLRALFGKDLSAVKELSELTSTIRRAAQHPQIAGSDTAPKLLAMFEQRFGSLSGLIREVVGEGLASRDAIPELMKTKEGMRSLRNALNVAMQPESKTKRALSVASDFVWRLSLLQSREQATGQNRADETLKPLGVNRFGELDFDLIEGGD